MSLETAREPDAALTFRSARPEDGKVMWSLVKAMGGLELNTAYFYILYCLDYADTCLVAEQAGQLAGFVLGHRPPGRDETVFVWQVGVSPDFRKQGLAGRMIEALLHQQPRAVRWLEATVTPDNTASRRLFSGLARRLEADCDIAEHLKAAWFPGDDHAPEDLFRIGPFDIESINA